MKKSLYKENGLLSDHGRELTAPLKLVVAQLLYSDDVQNLSDIELQTLGGTLKKLIADTISTRIEIRNEKIAQLASMSNAEFESYLKNKYGEKWLFKSLTQEELDRLPKITREDINKSMEEARKATAEYYNDVPPVKVTNLRIK